MAVDAAPADLTAAVRQRVAGIAPTAPGVDSRSGTPRTPAATVHQIVAPAYATAAGGGLNAPTPTASVGTTTVTAVVGREYIDGTYHPRAPPMRQCVHFRI
jgi:hypothetical protein